MSNPELVLEIVSALENKGVHVSIDDFGTGYSSLANLKKLPVTEIKIDRSFVMDMKEDNNDAVIVRSTIDLAHNMSLKVTAEGVENQETWDLLRSHGCDQAQGYFISRPIPAADFLEWAEKSISTARVASN
jgi:EAL domain-containing protein (putative c-di-GMP-specific phosphodiesterase class I)